MKRTLIGIGMLSMVSGLASFSALADNIAVENAIQSRSDLSTFYQALVNTGVNHELNANSDYTIFAPTNAAFARIRQDQYPCFYALECRARVAEIVRNHIIPGDIHVDNAAEQRGGIPSIGGRFVAFGEPYRNDYAVEGNNITYTSSFDKGILYKVDGVIANPRELASIQYQEYDYATPREVVTVIEKTIPDPACGVGGCPDATTETKTITRTQWAPSSLAPAR